jgi:hypothetical protein
MADLKISGAADPVTLVGTDKVPMARSASSTAYAATMAEVSSWTNSGLPYETALATSPGIASAGTVASVSRGDHVHPFDNTRVSKSGDAMTGLLSLPSLLFTGLPVNAVNDAAAATAGIPIGGVYRNGSVLMVRTV